MPHICGIRAAECGKERQDPQPIRNHRQPPACRGSRFTVFVWGQWWPSGEAVSTRTEATAIAPARTGRAGATQAGQVFLIRAIRSLDDAAQPDKNLGFGHDDRPVRTARPARSRGAPHHARAPSTAHSAASAPSASARPRSDRTTPRPDPALVGAPRPRCRARPNACRAGDRSRPLITRVRGWRRLLPPGLRVGDAQFRDRPPRPTACGRRPPRAPGRPPRRRSGRSAPVSASSWRGPPRQPQEQPATTSSRVT
jgi:hypothetical protein